MHVHAVQIPSGPQLISSAAPETPNHVHTFVTQVGTAERIHISGKPVELAVLHNASQRNGDHVHRVSLPLPLLRQNWRILTTGGAIAAPAKGQVGVPRSASAEPVWERFPGIRPTVAPGFMGLNIGPLQVRFGLSDNETPGEPGPSLMSSVGTVLPVLIGLGLLATAWYLADTSRG